MSNSALLLAPGIGYLIAGLVYTVRRLARAEQPLRWAVAIVWVSLAAHLVLVVARDYPEPAAPFASAREFLLVLSWLLVVAHLMTARWLRGIGISGLVLGAAGLTLVAVVPSLPAQPEAVPELLGSPWLLLHVPLILLADLMYALAGSGSIMYLVVSGLLKARRPIAISMSLPTLDSLDRFSHRMAEIGFPLLTAGLFAGMIWSHDVWGQLIPDTPKQAIAFASWGVYAAYFHARMARGVRGRFCAWLLVIGFVLVVIGLVVPVFVGGPHKFM
jgi:ABC-type transport system involved in cytochrome c biogenesis permease subunit